MGCHEQEHHIIAIGNSLGSQATFPARDHLLCGNTPVEVLGLHLIHAVLQHEIIRSARCLAQRAGSESFERVWKSGSWQAPGRSQAVGLPCVRALERPKALGHGALGQSGHAMDSSRMT